MKNIICLLLIIGLILTGCTYNSDKDNKSDFPDPPNNLEIICFDREKIIYNISDNFNNNNLDMTLFSFDLLNKQTKKIIKLENLQGIIDNPVLQNKNLIFTIKKAENQYEILKIDMNSYVSESILSWNSITHLTNLISFNNEILLYTVNTIKENKNSDNILNEYNIDLINIKNYNLDRIVSERYDRSNKQGSVISAVTVDDDFIYCFQDGNHEIIQYNIFGEEINRYTLDLKSFLEPSFLLELDLTDLIFQIKKSKQYFILSTLNQRKLIYKIDNSGLLPVSLPKELSAEFPNYRIAEINNGKFDNIYFINQSRGDKTVIIFESKVGKFKYLDIPLKENVMRTIYMNSESDLLIQEYIFDEHGNQKSELIFIKNENLNFYE